MPPDGLLAVPPDDFGKAHPTFSRNARTVVLALAVVAAWSTSVPGDFVWIDHVEIEQGGYRVLDTSDLTRVWTQSLDSFLERRQGNVVDGGGYFRPVYAISLSVDWALWGSRPWLYHMENILWHLVVVWSLFVLGRRLLRSHAHADSIAFWSALLFAVHPFGVHSVTWISGRKDLMCTAFSLWALLAFARASFDRREPVRRFAGVLWCAVSVVCFLLAVCCKELAFVVPLLASGWYWFERKDAQSHDSNRSGGTCLVLLWLCCTTAIFYRYKVIGITGLSVAYPSSSLAGNVGTFSHLWWTYVVRGLLPIHATIVDRWPIAHQPGSLQIAAMIGVLVVVFVAVFGLFRRARVMLFGYWYVLWMLPACGLIPLRHVYAERYLYPASWGLMGLAVVFMFVVCGSFFAIRRALLCAAVCALLACSALENRHWQNDASLFTHAIKQDSKYAEGRIGLAVLALSNQQFEKAVEHSRIAIDSARDPDFVTYWSPFVTHTNFGLALQNLNRYDEARDQFLKANTARPGNAITHYHLGLNAIARGEVAASAGHYQRALELKPEDFLTQSNLGHSYLLLGRLDDCIDLLQPLVSGRSDDLMNRINLGTAYLLSGRFQEAESQFEEIVRRQPIDAIHLAKLAWAEWKLGKSEEALPHLLAASEIQPNHPTVRHVAGMVLKGP